MENHNSEIHKQTDDARAGKTPNSVRYMLFFSLVIAITALSLIWINGSLNAH